MDGRRVVVAVTPRLLGDALCRALAQDGFRVVTAGGSADGAYDVAIVSPGRETDVVAARVITVDGGPPDLAALRVLLQADAD